MSQILFILPDVCMSRSHKELYMMFNTVEYECRETLYAMIGENDSV